MTAAPKSAWVVAYEGHDISVDLAPMLIRARYTDHLAGESDEIELALEDRDGRWLDGWWPERHDEITLSLGWEGTPLLPCGTFRIDDFSYEGPPDVATIRALAAGTDRALRTRRSRAFEDLTLRDVVDQVAAELELTVIGEVPDVRLRRVTQSAETSLRLLRRLAELEGYAMSVRGTELTFWEIAELEGRSPVVTLERGDLERYRWQLQTTGTYAAARVIWHNPRTNQRVDSGTVQGPSSGTSTDTLRFVIECDSAEAAERRARALLAAKNRKRQTGSITMEGNTSVVAGATIEIDGMAKLDGTYLVQRSTHSIDRVGGYVTEAEVSLV